MPLHEFAWNVPYILVTFVSCTWLFRRLLLPKPLPGIPYNRDAADRLFGDVPEMMGYVMRTKRIFVSHIVTYFHHVQALIFAVLAYITYNTAQNPHHPSFHQAWIPTMGRGYRSARKSRYSTSPIEGIRPQWFLWRTHWWHLT